jgi:3-phosphoshikimate 1-carboxyvinyltransferase
MDVLVYPAAALSGTLRIPPDKAICHRAVLLAAIAEGESHLAPWPGADDCQATLGLVEGLGARVIRDGQAVRITGAGPDGIHEPSGPLACGESGTTMRLAAGILAGQPFASVLDAGPLLSRRPMRRIVEPLGRMGARIEGAPGSVDVHPPLRIQGIRPLRAIRYETPVASAQVKSAILLAGLFADGPTTVVEPHATRDHTERLLRHCGIRVTREGARVSVEPGPVKAPGRLVLPGDVSSAAFFIVAAACHPGSRVALEEVGLNPSRTGFLRVLARMGARVQTAVQEDAWEPRGTLVVEGGALHGTLVEPQEAPGVIDELPVLMAAAACAKGTSRFSGIGELRVKETDRLQSMASGLQRLGAAVRITGRDEVEITGGRLAGGVPVSSAGDHRTAMSLAVAGLCAQAPVTIQGGECVAKSYPEFFDHLRLLAGSATAKSVDSPGTLC